MDKTRGLTSSTQLSLIRLLSIVKILATPSFYITRAQLRSKYTQDPQILFRKINKHEADAMHDTGNMIVLIDH